MKLIHRKGLGWTKVLILNYLIYEDSGPMNSNMGFGEEAVLQDSATRGSCVSFVKDNYIPKK